MKGLYFFDGYLEHPEYLGVKKKIYAQIEELEKNGISVNLYTLSKQKTTLEKILIRFPFFTIVPKIWFSAFSSDFDFVYLRYTWSDRGLISFLSKISKSTKKVILELPTYPYEGEWGKLKQIPILIKDRIYRKKLYKYVNCIVTFSKKNRIFNIQTISTVNGIKVDSVIKKEVVTDLNEICIISIASLAKWHGYDRFLNGMVEYYRNGGNRKIVYHCVGDGIVLEEYKRIVKENNLQKYVVFYGRQTGELLDEIYNRCTLAIASLGLHRIGGTLGSFLKTREYLAKGLPMITGCDIDILDKEKFPYFIQFPADESPIDIEKVIEFHDRIYLESGKTQEEIVDEIRDFAYRTCDMSVAMKPIIDYIKSIEE